MISYCDTIVNMTSQSARQIRRTEQKQKLLVDAATDLFSKKGYAGTTIDDIAEKADVAKVTFYAYFKSKEEIALQIRSRCMEEAISYTETLLAKKLDANEMIEAVIKDVAEWTEENWQLLDVFCALRFSPLFERGAPGQDETRECKAEPMVICLEAIISRGQKAGLYRSNVDSLKIAHLLDLAILCEQHYWIQSGRPSRKALEASLEKCFDFALNGIAAR
jgi:AcrR family transcriptional regulator